MIKPWVLNVSTQSGKTSSIHGTGPASSSSRSAVARPWTTIHRGTIARRRPRLVVDSVNTAAMRVA